MWWVSYAVTAVALVVVGGVGGKATEIGPWYRSLRKPSWNPPDWAFPVVWTTIYLFIIYSVGRVWNAAEAHQHSLILILVGVNFVLNMLWSVFFFTIKNPLLALFEVVLLWLSIVAMMIGFVEIDKVAAWMLVPYLAWVSIAAILNLSIVRLNPTSTTDKPS